MKTIKTRLISVLLVVLTLLSLLPTSALAATGTGKGITITTNQAYWSTRILANGTPYSYRPPEAAGRLLYCLDSGLGYHNATPSYCDSYTYTSATGIDADAVLKRAVANSGLGEMDAATLANVKWLMTYINDSRASNIGQLFMAVQTYVWDNQSYKGEGEGTGDAGGYANADTYALYLSLIDSMLAQKAREDAEFQRQIAEYAAQGRVASVIEDDAAKWAVFALSSNRKNQSFFNYYAPRKLVVNDAPVPGKPAGDADITLKKVTAGTTRGLDGARFLIYRDGQIVGSDVTKNGGIIEVKDVTEGLWSFVEVEAPAGYCADSAPISVYVDTTDGDKQYTVTAENYALPDMKIIKRDAMSGKPIAGAVFSIKSVTGNFSTSVTTGTDGSATLSAIPAGVYVVREESVPEPYIVSNTEQTVALRPGQTSEVTFVDYEKPGLEIIKKNIANGEPIEGVTYRIEQIDGSYSTTATTDSHGRIFLDSIPVGTYQVTEINVPSHVILCSIPQEVALKAGETSTVTFFNALKPTLEIRKVDSVTGDPVKGAKFQIWYASNHTDSGELNDLGVYYTDESGKIILPEVKDGWYKVTELEAPHGYSIKEPATQECFIAGGESKVLTFENTPLSAIIIRKVDSESGQPLEGSWFRIRYLGGTSGTGGTVVGEYRTSSNGTIVVTGLKAGTYICEEISAPDGYVITDAAETVYLSGKDQDVITVTFGNDKMGSLLIVKKDAVTSAPISDVEFLVTDSDGSVIGVANGKYVTDSAGTIRIDGLTPGMTVIVTEVRAKDGYILDDTPQSIRIKRNSVMTLEFRNQPKGGVLVRKVDAVTSAPISDVEFLVTDSDGNFIGNANGKFVTDSAGSFTITDVAPDTTLIIKETRAKDGYILDDTPQTVKVKSGEVVTVEFRNYPNGSVLVKKVDAVTKAPISDVEFLVTDVNGNYIGNANGKFVTDSTGTFIVAGVAPDTTLIIKETHAKDGYILDDTPRTVKVKSGEVVMVEFRNAPLGSVLVKKVDAVTKAPISDVEFLVTDTNGNYIGNANGKFVTDSTGTFIVAGVAPDTALVIKEVRAKEGYILDDTPQTAKVKSNEIVTVEFRNQPKGSLIVVKQDSVTKAPLEGVQFKIVYANGSYVDAEDGTLSSNGLYWTDKEGKITLSGISGTVVVTEVETIPGYTIDENTRTQTVVVNPNDTQTLYFYNVPIGGVEIIKVNADKTSQRIPNTTFEIRKVDGALMDTVTTGKNGRAFSPLEDGTYYAVEIKAAEGYQLDDTPLYFEIKNGKTTTLTARNKALSGILIHKIDSTTGDGIYGATFLLYDSGNNPIAQETSDDEGYVRFEGLMAGRYYLRELENEGYIPDTQRKTVYVRSGETTEVTWKNTPITGQIQITKYAEASSPITGQNSGTPLKGATYEFVRERSGKVVDYITTDARGVAASKPLPLGRYLICEVSAPAYYRLSAETFDVTLEYAGQIIKLAAYNKPVELGVSITKRGNAQVMVGQSMLYDLTVANTSNVPLESFFWHDKIPYDAARATTLTTGTYSARLNYRILYRTNYNASYQVLASNLLTSNNYSFALNAIPMQAGEAITDVYFDFGKVPIGFQSVVSPTLSVMAYANAVNGYQMVNRADVGGKYQGTWQTAQASWVTIIQRLCSTPTLPKTGY